METLRALIALLKLINPVGARRIEQRVQDLSHEDVALILRHIMLADNLAWRNAWRDVARAWLLIHVSRWVGMGSYLPPKNAQTVLNGLVNRLRSAYEATVRAWITADMSPQALVAAIATLQADPSRAAWNPARFTDPMHHNPRNFRYLITALRPTAGLGVPSAEQKTRYDYLEEKYGDLKVITKGEDKNWTLHAARLLLGEPWRLRSEMLSCSIIDQDHTRTYGNFSFGFVLSAPSQNICLAATRDLAINNSQARDDILRLQRTPIDRIVVVDDFLESLHGLYSQPLPSPETILAGTSGGHNEVVVLGAAGSTSITVSAIFIKVTTRGMMWSTFLVLDKQHGLFKLITECSRREKIQIVAIPDDAVEGSDLSFEAWLKGATDFKPTIVMLPDAKESKYPETKVAVRHLEVKEPVRERRGPPQFTFGRDIVRLEGHFEGHDRTREYDMVAIRGEAKRLLMLGRSPANVHRQLHDVEGLPHEVAQHALNQLGFRNYI